jgi:O-antigen/teichoic acid export membrane protein
MVLRINATIRSVFYSSAPLVLYGILQSTVSSLIVGAFGTASAMADVGALTRLSLVLALFDRVIGTVFIPRIARMPRSRFRGQVFAFLGFYFAMMALLALTAWLAPEVWILLLGPHYTAQRDLVWLAVVGAILMNAGGLFFTICAARGAPGIQWPIFGCVIVADALFARHLDLAHARGALLFSLTQAAVFAMYQCGVFAFVMRATWRTVDTDSLPPRPDDPCSPDLQSTTTGARR